MTFSDKALYFVVNENTLCYWRPCMTIHLGVLAGSVIRGGHDWKNGPISFPCFGTIRPATDDDFKTYRVQKGADR